MERKFFTVVFERLVSLVCFQYSFYLFSFGWRANVDALHLNFKNHIAVFPEHLRHEQYMGRVLFIGGSESDYIKSVN